MELRDIYNENKERTGKVIEADAKRDAGEYILCVGCWIVNHKGEIFITKRSPEKRYIPNKWENTGGHAVAGEDGRTAILRELYEETGIKVERDELILLSENRRETVFVEDYVAIKDFDLSDVHLQEGETCDCRWISESVWNDMLANGDFAPSVIIGLMPHKQKLNDIICRFSQ